MMYSIILIKYFILFMITKSLKINYRMPILTVLFFLISFLYIPKNLFSQENTFTLSGMVTELESGENIIGVPVALYKDTTEKRAVRGALSNKFGFYSIPKLEVGEYFMVVSGVGYETSTKKIIINSDSIINVKLNIQPTLAAEVVITADRISEPINRISTVEVKPDFIKTSTGFGTYGARLEDVKLMKETVGYDVKIKAAGGIKDLKTMLAMIEAGAKRIGTSSGISIMKEYQEYLNQ